MRVGSRAVGRSVDRGLRALACCLLTACAGAAQTNEAVSPSLDTRARAQDPCGRSGLESTPADRVLGMRRAQGLLDRASVLLGRAIRFRMEGRDAEPPRAASLALVDRAMSQLAPGLCNRWPRQHRSYRLRARLLQMHAKVLVRHATLLAEPYGPASQELSKWWREQTRRVDELLQGIAEHDIWDYRQAHAIDLQLINLALNRSGIPVHYIRALYSTSRHRLISDHQLDEYGDHSALAQLALLFDARIGGWLAMVETRGGESGARRPHWPFIHLYCTTVASVENWIPSLVIKAADALQDCSHWLEDAPGGRQSQQLVMVGLAGLREHGLDDAESSTPGQHPPEGRVVPFLRVEPPARVRPEESTSGPRWVDSIITLRSELFFEMDRCAINPTAYSDLADVARNLADSPEWGNVRVEGHASREGRGKRDYNIRLSRCRAQRIVDFLVHHGVDGRRLSHFGFGYLCPQASNDTELGRRENRRVELVRNPEAHPPRCDIPRQLKPMWKHMREPRLYRSRPADVAP